jgi:hypothetical protein
MFTGTDCPHCEVMRPLVAKLIYETGAEIEERDTWKSQSEYRLLENYQSAVGDRDCDGIPFFYNTESGDYLCGEVSYKKLKAWATAPQV